MVSWGVHSRISSHLKRIPAALMFGPCVSPLLHGVLFPWSFHGNDSGALRQLTFSSVYNVIHAHVLVVDSPVLPPCPSQFLPFGHSYGWSENKTAQILAGHWRREYMFSVTGSIWIIADGSQTLAATPPEMCQNNPPPPPSPATSPLTSITHLVRGHLTFSDPLPLLGGCYFSATLCVWFHRFFRNHFHLHWTYLFSLTYFPTWLILVLHICKLPQVFTF